MENFIAHMQAGSRAERARSVSRCTFRKTNVCIQLGRGWFIPEGIASSTPSHGREGTGGIVIIHVWARKTQVIRLPFPIPFHPCWRRSHARIQPGIHPSSQGRGEGEVECLRNVQPALPSAPGTGPAVSWPSHGACGKGTVRCQSSLLGGSQGYI